MNKGTMIREKEGLRRTGLITDYDTDSTSPIHLQARWCEILWSDGQLECFDSLNPEWDKWHDIEVVSESW